MGPALHWFEGFGIELEYMIVNARNLDVLPVADKVLETAAGRVTNEHDNGAVAWSNELALHVIEIKSNGPTPDLPALAADFVANITQINDMLGGLGGRLMPTGMHPWMDPHRETRLWNHDDRTIYDTYNRIFDCRGHGWSNLQSMHLNLPFADDEEFRRLHAAVRLLLPVLPALCASSPFADGRDSGWLDYRLAVYRHNADRVPSITGGVVPENADSRAEYERNILAPMYADIAPLDPAGTLRHEWLNSRGAIARFDRNAIEIRVLDVQECPLMDVACAALISAVLQSLVRERWRDWDAQRRVPLSVLVDILEATMRQGGAAMVADRDYLDTLGRGGGECTAQDLWRHLIASHEQSVGHADMVWAPALNLFGHQGCLAQRIRDAAGHDCSRRRLHLIYAHLCDCLHLGEPFRGLPAAGDL